MKLLNNLNVRVKGITKAGLRFPATFLLLAIIAVLNAISIELHYDYEKIILALAVGVFISADAQVLYERFGKVFYHRVLLYLVVVVLTIGYYLALLPLSNISQEASVRTIVAVFALFIAFMWVPCIKNDNDFNAVFLINFKSFFTTAFFSVIIWGGISLIIAAVNQLLFHVSSTAYSHVTNIIWVLFAPIFFLSMIPIFNSSSKEKEKLEKSSLYPGFLEKLISYILIPLTAVYSLVLIIYIIKTIAIQNWADNLLEPLILSFCLAVIIIYILASGLKNSFARLFRLIFPKVLVPVALFQIIASSINAYSSGIVLGRYFVLMFGLYSMISGILLSFIPLKKNGMLAAIVIVFAVITITPPIDGFTVSRISQTAIFTDTLEKNDMIDGNDIVSRADISKEDKNAISKSLQYLNNMGELKDIKYLPEGFNLYSDFEKTFGFSLYDNSSQVASPVQNYSLDPQQPVGIGNFEYMSNISLPFSNDLQNTISSFTKAGIDYKLVYSVSGKTTVIKIIKGSTEIISAEINPMIDSIAENSSDITKGFISQDKLTFDVSNNNAKMRVIFQNISINNRADDIPFHGSAYVLFTIN